MPVKYEKFRTEQEWKHKEKELCAKAGNNLASATKMKRNRYVTTEILAKICTALAYGNKDTMELVLDECQMWLITIKRNRTKLICNWNLDERRIP